MYFEGLQGNSSAHLKLFLEFEIVFKILANINALYGFEVHENAEVQGRIKKEVSEKPLNKELAVQKQTHTNNKIQKKKPSLTDRQAIEYLIRHVFSKSE